MKEKKEFRLSQLDDIHVINFRNQNKIWSQSQPHVDFHSFSSQSAKTKFAFRLYSFFLDAKTHPNCFSIVSLSAGHAESAFQIPKPGKNKSTSCCRFGKHLENCKTITSTRQVKLAVDGQVWNLKTSHWSSTCLLIPAVFPEGQNTIISHRIALSRQYHSGKAFQKGSKGKQQNESKAKGKSDKSDKHVFAACHRTLCQRLLGKDQTHSSHFGTQEVMPVCSQWFLICVRTHFLLQIQLQCMLCNS